MLITERKPAGIAEILAEEFVQPMGLTQAAQRKHVNELCSGRRSVTASTALILARVSGNSPDFLAALSRFALLERNSGSTCSGAAIFGRR